MVADESGKEVEVSQIISPPIFRRDHSLKGRDASLADLHVNESTYHSAVRDFNTKVLEHYLAQATGRKSTLVFCSSIGLVDDLTQQFKAAGIVTGSISSDTPDIQRAETVVSFRDGVFPVLINCMMLIEGYDAPQVSPGLNLPSWSIADYDRLIVLSWQDPQTV
jgi:superfamily II DNA or RNA helicase